jgi:hypothetical protein
MQMCTLHAVTDISHDGLQIIFKSYEGGQDSQHYDNEYKNLQSIVIMTFSITALSITVTNAKLSIILSVVILNFTAPSVVYIVYQCQTHQGPYSQHFIFFAPNKLESFVTGKPF